MKTKELGAVAWLFFPLFGRESAGSRRQHAPSAMRNEHRVRVDADRAPSPPGIRFGGEILVHGASSYAAESPPALSLGPLASLA